MELIDGAESVDAATVAKRMFGDSPIPQEILIAAKRFEERGETIFNIVDDPKNPYEQLRAIMVERFENRLAYLNDKIGKTNSARVISASAGRQNWLGIL